MTTTRTYRAGRYALVMRNSAETLRAYTLSSTPGVSEYSAGCLMQWAILL